MRGGGKGCSSCTGTRCPGLPGGLRAPSRGEPAGSGLPSCSFSALRTRFSEPCWLQTWKDSNISPAGRRQVRLRALGAAGKQEPSLRAVGFGISTALTLPCFPPSVLRAVQRSGAGGQRGSPLRQHQHQRELAAAHGAHPVRQRSRVGLSQDHVSSPEQLFPMARRPCAGRAVPGSVGERWQGWGSDPEGSYRCPRESPPLHSRLAPSWEQLPF